MTGPIRAYGVLTPDGRVFESPHAHGDAISDARAAGAQVDRVASERDPFGFACTTLGFVTEDGRFLTRSEIEQQRGLPPGALDGQYLVEGSGPGPVMTCSKFTPPELANGLTFGLINLAGEFEPRVWHCDNVAFGFRYKAAAVRCPDGEVFTGLTHGDALLKAADAGRPEARALLVDADTPIRDPREVMRWV